MKRSEIYKFYTDFCEENDRQAHGKSIFFCMMTDKGYVIKRNRDDFYYDNLSMKEKDFIKVDDTEGVPFEQVELVMTK